jgi:purine-nucleoside phosphorylase
MSKEQTPSAHIAANYDDIAKTVIMCGDPLRAKFIAEKYLENPVLYNEIRGMLGYTGYYNGKRVSVQGHGMGIPSIGIYSYELFNFYDVERIIRIGTAGALTDEMKIGDMLFAQAACTDSDYGHQYGFPARFAPIADFGLLEDAVRVARENNFPFQVGNIYSADVFYDESNRQMKWGKFGVKAVEMESSGLYINAAAAGKKALTICTISDQLVRGNFATTEQRRSSFTNMMKVALEIA